MSIPSATPFSVSAFSPTIFNISEDTLFSVTFTTTGGSGVPTGIVPHVQFRSALDNTDWIGSSEKASIYPVVLSTDKKTGTFVIPAVPRIRNGWYPTETVLLPWFYYGDGSDLTPSTGSKVKYFSPGSVKAIYAFDLQFLYGTFLAMNGALSFNINVFNYSNDVTWTTEVDIIPKDVYPTTPASPIKLLQSGQISLTGSSELTTGVISIAIASTSDIVKNLYEGRYDVTVTMQYTNVDGKTFTSNTMRPMGPGLITYRSLFNSSDSTQSTVNALAVNCSFTSVAPIGPLVAQIPVNDGSNFPDWVNNLDMGANVPGKGDIFDWLAGGGPQLYIDGKPHTILDELSSGTKFTVQLLELEGLGTFKNGSPVAVRVFTAAQGWRCARLNVSGSTYTSTKGTYPTAWVVDTTSLQFPSRPEEIFGIYRLDNNSVYQYDYVNKGTSQQQDAANAAARAAPCIIDTGVNSEILLGIDKIILIPGGFARPIDPYFVSPKIPAISLQAFSTPPQSLVYGDGGFVDGFATNATNFVVTFTGYINYSPPTQSMSTGTVASSLNPGELIDATCLGSGKFTSTSGTQYGIVIASEPSISSRPANLYYDIFSQPSAGSNVSGQGWRPLMSTSLARFVGLGEGPVSIVQIPGSKNMLLFQRSNTAELIQVYVCLFDDSKNALTLLDDEQTVLKSGVLTLYTSTVMPSFRQICNARFNTSFNDTDPDFNLIYDTWFTVVFDQGFHIFANPSAFPSTIVHLFYPLLTTSPFIDEPHGICVGIYGHILQQPEVETSPPATSTPPSTSLTSSTTTTPGSSVPQDPSNPLQQVEKRIVGGCLGSQVELVIHSATYSGTEPLYLEFQAINDPASDAMTFTVREWSSYTVGFQSRVFGTNVSNIISKEAGEIPVRITSNNIDCQLSVSWQPIGDSSSIDRSMVYNNDIWLVSVQPPSIQNLVPGQVNAGTGSLNIDMSGSHLPPDPKYSCTFTLTYFDGSPPNLQISNFQWTSTTNPGAAPASTELPLTTGTAMLTLSQMNLKFIVTDGVKSNDTWQITIDEGSIQTPSPGVSNKGAWRLPTVTGTYSDTSSSPPAGCTMTATCTGPVTNVSGTKRQVTFDYTINGKDMGSFNLTGQVDPNDSNPDDTTPVKNWSTITLSNGIVFTFENLTGSPTVNDTWSWQVYPCQPDAEIIAQRPVGITTSNGFWIVASTTSARGRFLQYNLPSPLPSTIPAKGVLPTKASLLPFRSTLEPYIGISLNSDNTTSTLFYFKGLKTPALSWSTGIQTEISPDQSQYGLFSLLGLDFQEAHSGAIYYGKLDQNGLEDTTSLTQYSDFKSAQDLVSAPRLSDALASELPVPGWKEPPPNPDNPQPPKYKPTAWLGIFPQYRFHIGQVQVIGFFATEWKLDVYQVSTALLPIVTSGNRQIVDETFFINTMIPATDPVTTELFQDAVSNRLSSDMQNTWLIDANGNKIDVLNNGDFATNVSFDVTTTDWNSVSKYMAQLASLRSVWTYKPSWTGDIEGRNVPRYWQFRIGGDTVSEYMANAQSTPAFQAHLTSIQNELLPQYLSTNTLFTDKFGSGAAAYAYLLTEPRLDASFAQLSPDARSKLVNAMSQGVAVGGINLLRAVANSIANRHVFDNLTTGNASRVFDSPVAVVPADSSNSTNASYVPQEWELMLQSSSSIATTIALPTLTMLSLARQDQSKAALDKLGSIMNDPRNQSPSVAHVPSTNPRSSAGRPLLSAKGLKSPVGISAQAERALETSVIKLDSPGRQSVGRLRKAASGAAEIFNVLFVGSMVAGTVGAWTENEGEGDFGKTVNAFSIIGDTAAAAQLFVNLRTLGVRAQILRLSEATTADVQSQAAELQSTMKQLENISRMLGGVLNCSFGILSVLSGVQEVLAHPQTVTAKVGAAFDLISGGLLIASGVIELASTFGVAALAIPGLGEILMGVGFAFSVAKVWLGGRTSIGAFGESFLDVFGIDGGLSQKDQITNVIRQIKAFAVHAKLSRIATKSPDPRDGGAEPLTYVIEPLYDVSKLSDGVATDADPTVRDS